MRRHLKWSIRGIGIAGVALSALWLIQLFLLPVIVRHEVRSAIAALGLSNGRFVVASASLFGTTLHDVNAGDLHADSIEARFTPLSIVRGKLTAVRITGASMRIDLDRPAAPPAVDASEQSPSSALNVPVDRIDVKTSKLIMKSDGREWTFPLDGSLDGRHLKLATTAQGWPLTIDADVDASWMPQHIVLALGNGAIGSDNAIRWKSATLDAKLAVSNRDDATSISLLSGSTLALQGVEGPNVNIADCVFDLGGEFDRREMTLLDDILETRNIPAISSAVAPMTMRVKASAKSAVAFEGTQAKGNLGGATLVAVAGFGRADRPLSAYGRLWFDKTSIKAPLAKMDLGDCAGEIPLAWNVVTPTAPGTISIGNVSVNGKPIAPMTASASFANGTLAVDGSWPIEEGKTLAAAPGVEFSGTFGLKTRITLGAPGGFAPQVQLSATDARIVAKDWDAEFDGISTSFQVASFAPLSSTASQVLAVKKARIGKLDLSDGKIQFRVENPDSIFVEETSWGWAGGTIASHSFRINPTKPDVDLVAYADELSLDQLMKVITNGSASGSGTLYGKLPVSIHWPHIAFGSGFLYATPGTGRLTLADNIGVVENLMDQSDPRFAKDDTMKQLKSQMLESLRDFDYKVLKVEFKTGPNGLVASIQAEGKGRSRPNLPEIVPTLNITGLDQLLNKVLVVKRAISQIGQPQGATR